MKNHLLAGMIALSLVAVMPQTLRAEDNIEKAGVAVGVSAGNVYYLPIKYLIVMPVAGLFGALSYVVTGGNTELTKQIWQDNFHGPYVIDADLARKGVGKRPELEEKNQPANP
jgi:hypothetical protein